MPQEEQRQAMTLMMAFTDSLCERQYAQQRMALLVELKKAILANPNNYYHDYYGNVQFVQVYEFIIECLSSQHPPELFKFLLHVLALMTKFWILSVNNLRQLYDGILEMFQQRMYCGQNCFSYLTALVEVMQDNQDQDAFDEDSEFKLKTKLKNCENTSVEIVRKSIENYFVHHLLNQILAFANVFLERAVVRNDQYTNQNQKEENSRSRVSQSLDRPRTSQEASEVSEVEPSQQYQLYQINQPEQTLLSILTLVRACLSYDFSSTSRHCQEQEHFQKSPIILPTKYSKYCKFNEFDILLKNQNTTEMMNYLFLVSSDIELKMQILNMLHIMARIHFRYFKNKSMYKVHLENIGYVVANLMTGLDLIDSLTSTSIANSATKQNTRPKQKSMKNKVDIVRKLGEIVGLLLYHQPTFYSVEVSLIVMLVEHMETFITNELLDPDHFEVQDLEESGTHFKKISIDDLVLIIEEFMGQIHKLKDYAKMYLHDNQALTEMIHQMYIKIGERYFKILNMHTKPEMKTINKKSSLIDGLVNTDNRMEKQIEIRLQRYNQNEFKNGQDGVNFQIETITEQKDENENQEETQINLIREKNQRLQQKMSVFYKELSINHQFLNQNESLLLETKGDGWEYRRHMGLMQYLMCQGTKANRIGTILSVFKHYCTKHYAIPKLNSIPGTNNQKQQKKSINILQWCISFMCNFEHFFYITCGHCRHSENWQKQLKMQLFRQLIQDLNSMLQLCINNMKVIPKIELKYIIYVIYTMIERANNQGRVPWQDYFQWLRVDLVHIVHFVVKYIQNQTSNDDSNGNQGVRMYEFEDEVMSILQVISNWNFVKKILTNLNSFLSLKKVEEIFSIVASTYTPNSPTYVQKQEKVDTNVSHYCHQNRQIHCSQDNEQMSRVLWLLLRMYYNLRNQVRTTEQPGRGDYSCLDRTQAKKILQELFLDHQQLLKVDRAVLSHLNFITECSHGSVLNNLFNLLKQSLKSASYLQTAPLMQIQSFLKNVQNECHMDIQKMFVISKLNDERNSINVLLLQQLLTNYLGTYLSTVQIERQYKRMDNVPKQDIDILLHLIKHSLFTIYFLQPTTETLTLVLQTQNAILELAYHLKDEAVRLAEQTIIFVKIIDKFMKDLPLEWVKKFLNTYLQMLSLFLNKDHLKNNLKSIMGQINFRKMIASKKKQRNSIQQGQNQINPNIEQNQLFMIDCFVYCLNVLVKLSQAYSYMNPFILELQVTVLNAIVPNNKNYSPTLLSLLQEILQECNDQKQSEIIENNLRTCVIEILMYLSTQCHEKVFVPERSIVDSWKSQSQKSQSNLVFGQEIRNQMTGIKYIEVSCISVYNLIKIFQLHHQEIETMNQLISKFSIPTEEVNSVLKEGMTKVTEMGLSWVINKLQTWNQPQEQIPQSGSNPQNEYLQTDSFTKQYEQHLRRQWQEREEAFRESLMEEMMQKGELRNQVGEQSTQASKQQPRQERNQYKDHQQNEYFIHNNVKYVRQDP